MLDENPLLEAAEESAPAIYSRAPIRGTAQQRKRR